MPVRKSKKRIGKKTKKWVMWLFFALTVVAVCSAVYLIDTDDSGASKSKAPVWIIPLGR